MMIQTPNTYLTFFTVAHIICPIGSTLITIFFSIFFELLLRDNSHILDTWVHELTKKVRNVDHQQTYTASYDDDLWVI